ncbi:hypothetical protein O3M35_010579 [Rhynocoris fuscipes]|uniref:Uncharacterized protein n=1 Tax=Rhynocoris fuscipes TaxID=488301 RepID=A0AAW1CZH2_9HEMI
MGPVHHSTSKGLNQKLKEGFSHWINYQKVVSTAFFYFSFSFLNSLKNEKYNIKQSW